MTDIKKPGRLTRFSIRTLLILVTVCAVGLFAKQRWDHYQRIELLNQWVDLCDEKEQLWVNGRHYVSSVVPCPEEISPKEQRFLLEYGALHLEINRRKTFCLKILAETFPQDCLDSLIQIALRSRESEIQCTAIQLIALMRDVNALKQIVPLLDKPHVDPTVRAAVIDCIGITRYPSYDTHHQSRANWGAYDTALIHCDPKIKPVFQSGPGFVNPPAVAAMPGSLTVMQGESDSNPPIPDPFIQQQRPRILKSMISGDSAEERIAAARAIVSWPPEDYSLRYAEWGVWINVAGEFKLAQSVIDEIPSFVHQTGNNLETFADRFAIPMIVTKPVIHLTADKSMAVDLEIIFQQGRPWFAFPEPDDFALVPDDVLLRTPFQGSPGSLLEFDDGVPRTIPAREGYPWLYPHHRLQHSWGDSREQALAITSLGLRWQSMIITPQKQSWMQPPIVDPDDKYKWWSDLREVDCSWISNLDESERFVYYDGPTLAQPPVKFQLEKDQLISTVQRVIKSVEPKQLMQKADEIGFEIVGWKRPGFFIDVAYDGSVSGRRLTLNLAQRVDVAEEDEKMEETELRAALLETLLNAGLNEAEAVGLVRCWEPAFFETPGRRVIYLLSPVEYELMCSLSIRPPPTEIVRVGIVLTEFAEE